MTNQNQTQKEDESNTYVISQKELFKIFLNIKPEMNTAGINKLNEQMTRYCIGSSFSINIRKPKKKTKKVKEPEIVIENPDGKSVQGLTYTGAIKYILKEHGPLPARMVYRYAMAYGWTCAKGGLTPSNTFAAILGTEASKGTLNRVKGPDGKYIYSLSDDQAPIFEIVAKPQKSLPKKQVYHDLLSELQTRKI